MPNNIEARTSLKKQKKSTFEPSLKWIKNEFVRIIIIESSTDRKNILHQKNFISS